MSEANAPIPLKRVTALTPGRFKPAESAFRTYFVLVEGATTRETVLHPSFWAHVASKLRVLDRIEVMDDHSTWIMSLLVRSVGRQEVLVTELWSKELVPASAAVIPSEFEVRHRGNNYKWSVIRLADKAVLKEFCQTREEAETWLRSHLKAMAA